MVTGGAGFIGSNLVRALLQRGVEVSVLHLPGDNLINLRGLDVRLVPGSVLDSSAVRRALEGCRQLYHLAAIFALWLPDMDLMRRVNVEGTVNVLKTARALGIEKTVYCSSIALFGGQGPGRLATEDSPYALGDTGSYYAETKKMAHDAVLDIAREGMNITIAAPCGPLGPGDYGPTPTGRALTSAINLPVALHIDTVSNMIDVRDVAEGHVLAMEKGAPGRSYLLGRHNISYGELSAMALRFAGLRKPVIRPPRFLRFFAGHAARAYSRIISRRPPLLTPAEVRIAEKGLAADCSRAERELGLSVRPLEVSVRDALVWFSRNGYITHKKGLQNILRGGDNPLPADL